MLDIFTGLLILEEAKLQALIDFGAHEGSGAEIALYKATKAGVEALQRQIYELHQP